jgi:serine/threonine protein kinase
MVAMKTQETDVTEEKRKSTLQEACLMAQFSHSNVLGLMGVCITPSGVSLLTSLCENGDLLKFLRNRQGFESLSPSAHAKLCLDVAEGMVTLTFFIANSKKYLSQFSFVHRDLACRNILVSSHYECVVRTFSKMPLAPFFSSVPYSTDC